MDALLVVDVQNDFCPGGALGVPGGDQVVDYLNGVRGEYPLTVFTKDWHPPGHQSFASQHPGTDIGEVIDLHGNPQVMWPDHCVQGTSGAAFHARLDIRESDPVFTKGELLQVDSYSGFLDNDGKHETGLREFLQEKGVKKLAVAGLATDYCVKFTVLDALKMGFDVHVLTQGCRAVNLKPGDAEAALQEMEAAGAVLID